MNNFYNFSKKINYNFNNINLLEESLTHPSVNGERNDKKNYQKLEFLGDSVLCMIITEYLLQNYSNETEGNLAKRRAGLVCGPVLSSIAKEIELGNNLIMAESEIASGGRNNDRSLEDALEALIGAIYLDGGYISAKNFVLNFWSNKFNKMIKPPADPKSSLQEWAQKLGKPIPIYQTISSKGPAHLPIFEVEVTVENSGSVIAKGTSKRKAERKAAKLMLEKIKEQNKND